MEGRKMTAIRHIRHVLETVGEGKRTIKIASSVILFCRFKRVHGGTVVLSERIQKIGRRAGKGS
jgi:hypothetical protein